MLLSALKSNMEDIGNRLPEVFSGFRSMSQTTHIAFANVFIPQRCTSIFPQMQNRSSCPHHSPWRSRTYAAVPLQRNMVTCGNPTGTGKRSNRRPRHTSRPPGKDTTGSPPPKPPLRLNLGDSERLQKVMSRLGVASRRNAEDMIAGGKVTVNGNVVREKGVLVNARVDRIAVNGKTVEAPSKAVWIAVHKPPGYLSLPKEGHRRTAASLLPRSQRTSMMPVGSIEEDFSGLLLMTNERGHIPELSKPNNPHVKEWVVDIDGIVSEAQIDPLRRGVKLNGETTNTLPADIAIVGSGKVELGSKKKQTLTRLELRVRESRHHLIQRLFETAGLTVLRASRKTFGPILLGSLKRGDFRYLTPNEVKALKRGVNAGSKSKEGSK